jgi:hypothetical protein
MATATAEKRIAIILQNRTDDPRIITVTPGMTVAEALAAAGFDNSVSLNSPTGGGLLDGAESLFEMVKDGDKLFASPSFKAGSFPLGG